MDIEWEKESVIHSASPGTECKMDFLDMLSKLSQPGFFAGQDVRLPPLSIVPSQQWWVWQLETDFPFL